MLLELVREKEMHSSRRWRTWELVVVKPKLSEQVAVIEEHGGRKKIK